MDTDPVTLTLDLDVRNAISGVPLARFSIAADNVVEGVGRECLVATLSVDESQLDPRDRGQVDIFNGVALSIIADASSKWVYIKSLV